MQGRRGPYAINNYKQVNLLEILGVFYFVNLKVLLEFKTIIIKT